MSNNATSELSEPLIPSPMYDKLKFIALILLPALGALYFGIAQIWGLPNANEVVGTITVVDTFLGVMLGISSTTYRDSHDGTVDITHEGLPSNLSIDKYTEDLLKQDTVKLKVRRVDKREGTVNDEGEIEWAPRPPKPIITEEHMF